MVNLLLSLSMAVGYALLFALDWRICLCVLAIQSAMAIRISRELDANGHAKVEWPPSTQPPKVKRCRSMRRNLD
jgi:hypothetical protein